MDDGADPPRPDLRVGDAERRSALEALGTHLEAGRLTVDEYADRSGAASVAVHRAELAALFDDLPAPHPTLPERPERPERPGPVDHRPAVVTGAPVAHRPGGPPVVAFAVMMALIVGLPALLLLTVPGAQAGGFLVVPLVFLLLGGLRHRHGRRRRGYPHGRS